MENKIVKTEPVIFDKEGNQILEEKIDGGGKTQVIKYGLIKLIGEKQEHKVSYKTLLDINNAKNSNFTGQINIPEINMSVQINQIVMLRSGIENIRVDDDITNLPTTNICLDSNMQVSEHIRPYFIRNKIPYYEATVHYVERNGEKQYYLELDKIKRLLKVDFDKDGYDYISKIYHYGIKQ